MPRKNRPENTLILNVNDFVSEDHLLKFPFPAMLPTTCWEKSLTNSCDRSRYFSSCKYRLASTIHWEARGQQSRVEAKKESAEPPRRFREIPRGRKSGIDVCVGADQQLFLTGRSLRAK